jgi:hypothetical protein
MKMLKAVCGGSHYAKPLVCVEVNNGVRGRRGMGRGRLGRGRMGRRRVVKTLKGFTFSSFSF